MNENVSIAIKLSLNFVAKGPINNIPALVQIMALHRPGDKPLSEPMSPASEEFTSWLVNFCSLAQGPLLLTWIKSNPYSDKCNYIDYDVRD